MTELEPGRNRRVHWSSLVRLPLSSPDKTVKRPTSDKKPEPRDNRQAGDSLGAMPIHGPARGITKPFGLDQAMPPILTYDVCLASSCSTQVGGETEWPERPKPNRRTRGNCSRCNNHYCELAVHDLAEQYY